MSEMATLCFSAYSIEGWGLSAAGLNFARSSVKGFACVASGGRALESHWKGLGVCVATVTYLLHALGFGPGGSEGAGLSRSFLIVGSCGRSLGRGGGPMEVGLTA